MAMHADGNGEVFRRADLLAMGMRPTQITAAVRRGELLRVRRDRYMVAPYLGIDRAVRVGGRLACVSLLAALGAFVFDADRLHVHVDRAMSRMRSPDDATLRFRHQDRAGVQLHWWSLHSDEGTLGTVAVADALAQAVRCQDARSAVATVDSVLHQGLLSPERVADVFHGLPRKYRAILRLSDAIAESGSETLMRLILRQMGLRFVSQAHIPGVGRVDFLVEGWLIIECDSKAHHEGWAKQRSDRHRDLAAAQAGYVTLRPLAEDLFYRRDEVTRAVRGLMRRRR